MRLVISDGKIEFAGTPVIEHINFDIKDVVDTHELETTFTNLLDTL